MVVSDPSGPEELLSEYGRSFRDREQFRSISRGIDRVKWDSLRVDANTWAFRKHDLIKIFDFITNIESIDCEKG